MTEYLSALARNYGDVFWDYIASVVGGDHAADAQRVPVRLRHRNSVEAYLGARACSRNRVQGVFSEGCLTTFDTKITHLADTLSRPRGVD